MEKSSETKPKKKVQISFPRLASGKLALTASGAPDLQNGKHSARITEGKHKYVEQMRVMYRGGLVRNFDGSLEPIVHELFDYTLKVIETHPRLVDRQNREFKRVNAHSEPAFWIDDKRPAGLLHTADSVMELKGVRSKTKDKLVQAGVSIIDDLNKNLLKNKGKSIEIHTIQLKIN